MSGKNPFLSFGFVSPFITFIRASISKNLFLGASLDLNFTENLSLIDDISGNNLVTFSRASSGTYVGSDGLIKTSAVNLLPYSEQFDQWSKGSATVITSNAVAAPDGTFTADRVYFPSSGTRYIAKSANLYTGKTYTFSIWAKAVTPGTNNEFLPKINSPTARFPDANFVATSEWKRFIFTFTHTDPDASTSVLPLNINLNMVDVYLWGAQLEEGNLSDYIPTTTTASGAPRFDHDPVTGESLGLLIEESRTNRVLSSQSLPFAINPAYWTITDLSTGAPNGEGFARVNCVSFNNVSLTFNYDVSGLVSGSSVLTVSLYARSNDTNVKLGLGNPDVTILGTTPALTSEWVRYSGTFTWSGSNVIRFFRGAGSISAGQSFDVCMVSIEAGSFPTSYIPTTGSTVTRAADVASIEGTNFSSWYNDNEGTWFTDMTLFFTNNAGNPYKFGGVYYTTVANAIRQLNNQALVLGLSNSQTVPSKTAFGMKPGDYKLYRDGTQPATSTSTSSYVPAGTELRLAPSLGGMGHISRLAYFPTRKSDQDLIKITGGTLDLPIITYGITSTGGVFNLRSTGTVDYAVDWDSTGGYESSTSNTLPHTYTAGNYDLVVYSNDVYRPFFENSGDEDQITSVAIGSGADLGTDLSRAWYGANNITSFVCPFDVTSSVTNFNVTWLFCTSLASFPLIDTSSGTIFNFTWTFNNSLTSFPLIDTSSGTNFFYAWNNCTSLANFPANMFDTTGTLIASAFNNTWTGCALTAQSIENILVSLDTNGATGITLSINDGTNAAKTTWTTAAVTAYDNLIVKGWTISFNA